jgi:fructan beta-fructosidase
VTFTAQSGPHALGLGPDDYAAVSWNNVPNRRKVILGWMNHWTYANQTPTQDEGWRGVMTMPRVLSMYNGALTQRPPEEFLKRRGEPSLIAEEGIACHAQAFEVELKLDLTQLRAAEVGIRFRNDAEEFVQIIYSQKSGEICIDRMQSGKTDFHEDFAGVFRAPLPIQNQFLKLNIFVDSCSVEVFAQEGLLYGAALVFPSAVWRKVQFIGDGARIEHGALYPLS